MYQIKHMGDLKERSTTLGISLREAAFDAIYSFYVEADLMSEDVYDVLCNMTDEEIYEAFDDLFSY